MTIKNIMDRIGELEAMGFKRWQKVGNNRSYDRLYIDAKDLGLDVSYYKTGNVSGATFDGCRISNSEARRMLSSKTYIDLIAHQIYSDNFDLAKKVAEIVGVDTSAYEYAGRAIVYKL